MWISGGEHELMIDDIREFAHHAREDGVDLELVEEDASPHAWQLVADAFSVKEYISRPSDLEVDNIRERSRTCSEAVPYHGSVT